MSTATGTVNSPRKPTSAARFYEVALWFLLFSLVSGLAPCLLPASPADEGPTAPGVKVGDLYAVLVGVSKYRDSKIPRLKLSATDATSFAEFLKTQNRLFNKIYLKLLLDDQATGSAIKKELYYKLRKAGKDDTVILFFSGHGSDDPYLPGEFYFVPYDGEPDNLQGSAVRMTGLRFLKTVSAKRVVLIADSCHAGGFAPEGRKTVAPSLKKFMAEFGESSGRVVITSSKPDEFSMELPGLKNGVFTHYLLKGLKGEADKDQNGVVTIREAYDYVYSRTKDRTEGAQHPQFDGRVVGAFPVSFVGPSGTRLEVRTEPPLVEVYVRDKSRFKFMEKSDDKGLALLKDLPIGKPIIIKLGRTGWKDKILNPIFFSDDELRMKLPAVTLDKALAFLVLKTNIAEASVRIDGKPAGATGCDKILIMDNIQVGIPHKVTINKEGYHEKTVSITVPVSREGKVYKSAAIDLRAKAKAVAVKKPSEIAAKEKVDESRRKMEEKRAALKRQGEQLIQAARSGKLDTVRRLLAKKTDANSRDERGWTPLMHACSGGHKEVAGFLLSKAADANAMDHLGWTPLMLAAGYGDADLVKLLMKSGADPKAKDIYGQTVIMKAKLGGHNEVLKLLGVSVEPPRVARAKKKEKQVSPVAEKKSKEKELIQAASKGKFKAVKKLLAEGVNVDARDQLGWTALMHASAGSHIRAAKLLVSRGADVNGTNNLGWSSLMIAAGKGHAKIVKLLLAKGADKRATNMNGQTAAMKARAGRHKVVLRLLGESPGAPASARSPRVSASASKKSAPRKPTEDSMDFEVEAGQFFDPVAESKAGHKGTYPTMGLERK